jgi:hypothetical protein
VNRRRAVAGDVVSFAGGAALLASAFTHWVRRGPGSGLRGHDLVDAIVGIGRHVPALSAGRLTVLWYLVPALGAASWVALGLGGVTSRATRVIAITALVVVVLVVVAFARIADAGDLGIGPVLALAGAVALVLAPRAGGRHRSQWRPPGP